ncbi:MAG: hypothetical protein ACI4F4_02810 [Lachnospiraceae bacterium]
MKLLSKDYKKINSIQMIPTIICSVIYFYTLIILSCNMITIKLPFYSLMDGTRCVMSLCAIILLTYVAKSNIPYIFKKINFFVFGLLFCMAIINADIYWCFMIITVMFFVLYQESSKRIFFSLLTCVSVLMLIYEYVDYKGYDDNSLAISVIPHDYDLILIALCLLLCYPGLAFVRKKLTGNVAKFVYHKLFFASCCITFLFGVLFCLKEFLHVFANVRYIPKTSYYGTNCISGLLAFDITKKITACVMLVLIFVLFVFLLYKRGRQGNIAGNLLLLFVSVYALLFSGVYGVLFCVICNVFGFLLTYDVKKWCVSYTLSRKKQYGFVLILTAILYLSSFFVDDFVNDFIIKKVPNFTLTMDDIRNDETLLKGFSIMEDGTIRSDELDPWILIEWEKYGISELYNVNVVTKLLTNQNEKIMIYGWPVCDSMDASIRKGKNVYALNNMLPINNGVRLDLTSQKNTFILIDKIVLNDFSSVGNGMAWVCRKISYGMIIILILCDVLKYIDCWIYKGEKDE